MVFSKDLRDKGKIDHMADLVSICIPAYNAGKYLSHTLDSVLAQTYSDIEIIVSDNASTDETRSIIEDYEKRDARVRMLVNDENIGYVRNIKRAVGAARGDLIAIYHADDVYEPQILEREVNVLSGRPDVSAVFSKWRSFSGEIPELRNNARQAWEDVLPKDQSTGAYFGGLTEFLPVLLRIGNPFCCPSFMTRKREYLSLGGFTDIYPSNEDLELWLKYLLSGKRLAITESILINYRHSPTQGSAYWEERLELPVFYKVLDDMVIPLLEQESPNLHDYKIRKATRFFELACRVPRGDKRRRIILDNSAATYMFPLCSEIGFLQRFPGSNNLIGFLKRNSRKMKSLLRYKFPKAFQLVKRFVHG